MAVFQDITGQRFGYLIVLQLADPADKSKWLCMCDCGRQHVARGSNLKRGLTRSCGCYRIKVSKQQGFVTPENISAFRSWTSAKNRCFNPSADQFAHYGGRGITMCDRWRHSFLNFFEDMGPRPEGTTLDRIDNDGDYAPQNCRWSTQKEQVRNQSVTIRITHNGETLPLAEWAERTGIPHKTLKERFYRGSDLFAPVRVGNYRRKGDK